MRLKALAALLLMASAPGAAADPQRGQQVFAQACIACHSLEPEKHMTGPSLSGLLGRKAGSLPSFPRYSAALKSADVEWTDDTLNAWIADPQALIPGNNMVFPGIDDGAVRADLIEFLEKATQPGSETPQSMPGTGGMMGMGANAPKLKDIPPASQVKSVRYCQDTYTVTTGDDQTIQFWERNLRFKTDSGPDGPRSGSPAILGAGMVGDRASVIFAAPEEFGEFIKRECPIPN